MVRPLVGSTPVCLLPCKILFLNRKESSAKVDPKSSRIISTFYVIQKSLIDKYVNQLNTEKQIDHTDI